MKYWISINTYLWKNIFNRWLESPLAPVSKVVLSLLLSLLAFVVIGLLRNAEQVLEDQFNRTDVLTSVIVMQDISKRDPAARLSESLYREASFRRISKDCELNYFRRANVVAKGAGGEHYPVVVCFAKPTFWLEEWGDFERPEVYFFSDRPFGANEHLTMGDFKFKPECIAKVPWLSAFAKGEGVLLVPYPMGRMLLRTGFSELVVLRFNEVHAMRNAHEKIEIYCAAEDLNYSLFSSLSLLSQLELFSEMQTYVRGGLALLIIVITAIVLGNQSLLEFREQQYQFALMRSFGSPLSFIMLAELMEKILLALSGVALAYLCLEPISAFVHQLGADYSMVDITLTGGDVRLILLGVLSGALSSWCFLLWVARKPVGLVLG